jgi:ABC-type Na+ efflux pump permease subunit
MAWALIQGAFEMQAISGLLLGIANGAGASKKVQDACDTLKTTNAALDQMTQNIAALGQAGVTQQQAEDQITNFKKTIIIGENWLKTRRQRFRIQLVVQIVVGILVCILAVYVINTRSKVLEDVLPKLTGATSPT